MREDSRTSSAIPDDLYAFNSGIQGIDLDLRLGPAARARAAMADFLATEPEFGGGEAPLDGRLGALLAHSTDLGAWVEAVATAFFEAGSGRLRRGHRDPDDPGWDGTATWTADDSALAAQLRADSPEAQASREAAAGLADRLKSDAGNLDASRADIAELDANSGNVIFATAFFNRLGPGMTLWLERELIDFSHYGRYQAWEHDPFAELLRPLDEALATATRGGGLTPADHLQADWVSEFIGQKEMRSFDLSNLLQAGAYSTDFLVTVGQKVSRYTEMDRAFGGYPTMISQRWPGVAVNEWDDPLVSILAAIGRDPDASTRLFADAPAANGLLSLGGDPENQLVAGIARAGIEGLGGDDSQRRTATFNVFNHFASAESAPADYRALLAELVAANLGDLSLDADVQAGGGNTLNPDGSIYLRLDSLRNVLKLAMHDSSDSQRVLQASSGWAAGILGSGPLEGSTSRVGRWYGMMVAANDTHVAEARANDERRRQFLDSIDQVVGLIPLPGEGILTRVAGDGTKLLFGGVLTDVAGSNTEGAATTEANSFRDAVIQHLDYLAGAAAFARDPAGFSSRLAAPVVVTAGKVTLAPEAAAGRAYQLWYEAYADRLSPLRTELDAGLDIRREGFPAP